jgi:hypothetical protein
MNCPQNSLLLLAISCIACSAPNQGGESSDGGEDPADATQETTSEASGEDGMPESIDLSIRENPDSTINPFADVLSPGAGGARVRVYLDGEEVAVREAPERDSGRFAFLWGLHAQTTYTAIAEADVTGGQALMSDEVTFTTGSLPPGMPDLTLVSIDEDRAHDGLVIVPVVLDERQGYLGIDRTGLPAWYHIQNYPLEKSGGDLKVTTDGRFMIFRPGGIAIIEPWGETVWNEAREFHHDVTPMPNGDLLTLTRRTELFDVPEFGGEVQVEADGIIQITPEGEVVQEWWTSDHIDHLNWPSGLGLQAEPLDWTHSNAIVYLEAENRIVLSMRHQWGIMSIDWTTGDVEWKLGPDGDFTLLDGDESDWFYNQHSPELQPDGTWLLYDNGTERPNGGMYSRAVRMEVDHQAMTARVAWEHVIPAGTPVQGDADLLDNGNILSCAGGVLNTGNIPHLLEATNDEASEIVWDVTIENADSIYRATAIPNMDDL